MKEKENNSQTQPRNILNLRPKRAVQWEENEDGTVILLTPKFENKLLVKYLLPRMKSKNIKIKLDDVGSWVWRHIDGERTILQIGELMEHELAERAQPVYERLGLFMNMLLRRKFILLKDEHV